jgi:hypothetical protein
MKIRTLAIALATILSSVNPSLVVFGQCRSVAGGTWQEDGGLAGVRTYTLSQNVSTGAITGTTTRAACQAPTWDVSGQFNTGGTFTLHATNPAPWDPVCTASWFTLNYTVRLPGCQHADGSWTNSWGQTGEDEMNKPCDVPTGESISTGSWGPAYPTRTHHGWIQILTSLNPQINFGGRAIIEEFPSPGTDDCHFAGSMFDPTTNPDPGAWLVGDVNRIPSSTLNIWGGDYIGWDENVANYYQVHRFTQGFSLPCDFTTTQRMNIACDAGNSFYKSGVIKATVDVGYVGSTRHSQSTSKQWP